MRREANARGEGACRHSASLSQWIDKVHERIFFFWSGVGHDVHVCCAGTTITITRT